MDVAHYFQRAAVQHIINRERRRRLPQVPDNFADLDVLLRDHAPINAFYLSRIRGIDGSIGYVFGDAATIFQRMGNTVRLSLDFNCQVTIDYI